MLDAQVCFCGTVDKYRVPSEFPAVFALSVLFCFGLLKQGLTVYPSLASESPASLLNLLSAGILSTHHHSQLFNAAVTLLFLMGVLCPVDRTHGN